MMIHRPSKPEQSRTVTVTIVSGERSYTYEYPREVVEDGLALRPYVQELINADLQQMTLKSFSRLPDGRVMCCICFEYFVPEDLAMDELDQLWDVCVYCWDAEQQAMRDAR